MTSEAYIDVEMWAFRPPGAPQSVQFRPILRRVLGRRLGLPPDEVAIEIAPGGKPHANGCEFSISHSGPWLVIATGATELGVDIETRMPRLNVMDLARRFFSEGDTAKLRDSENAPRDFLGQWVAKEAALKAAGVGLAGGLNKARCLYDGGAIRAVAWTAEHFAIHEFALDDGTPGALAWRQGPLPKIRWREAAEAGLS